MKASGGPQKLRFTIHAASGEDTDYPVRELLYHSPQTRGWQSPRFCKFPQEVVLRLERPSKIQQIQILSHEYKIPTKIEVFVGFLNGADSGAAGGGGGSHEPAPAGEQQPGSDGGAQPAPAMRRLGYLSFDSNERSSHQARELKSVHVTVDAQLVRLVIHRCHVNKLNIYNQVGIIALNLIGEPLRPAPEGPPPFLDVAGPASHEVPYYNRAAGEVANLQLDMHVDSVTAARIKELARAKDAAVAAEDYDEAKRLKGAIERLKVVGGKVAQLEARKRLAVEREDYDLAKALKADIDKLRAAGETAAAGHALVSAGSSGSPPLPRPQPAREPAGDGDAAGPGDFAAAGDAAAAGLGLGAGLGDAESSFGLGAAGLLAGDGGGFRGSGGGAAAGQQQPLQSVLHTYQAYEDRPAVAKGAYGDDGAVEAAASLGDLGPDELMRADPSRVSAAALFGSASGAAPPAAGGSRKALALSGGGAGPRGRPAPARVGSPPAAASGDDGAACGGAPPPGWPSDLPPPEPLAAVSAKDAEPVLDLAGEFVAAAFFSRSWQLRDAAAAWLADLVGNGRLSGGGERRELARSLVRLAVKGLRDKVPQVYCSCLGLLQALLTALASGGGGSRDVGQAVEAALPVLLERLSDNNSRLRDAARDALVALAQEPEGRSALRGLTGALCKPPRSQTAWRPVLAMLQLLAELLPLLGLAGAPGGGRSSGGAEASGFDLAEAMSYAGSALGSPNADVRAAALRVCVALAQLAGPAPVRRLLPAGLNPKTKEQVDAALGLEGGGGAQQATPAPAQQARPGRASSNGAASTRAAGKPTATSGRQAAPAAGSRQQHAAALQAQQPPPAQQQQPSQGQAQSQQQQQQLLAGLEGEDPAPFEAELAARERRYGPEHPAVAESCANLAILHNQRGDYAAALPLYERALAIYEATYGPHHQEVAHTLTDLAVLHLEQGHDDIGRPLLQRALVIQEAALGPEHPDVIAIRDVLDSE